ncbi:MAG: hypothetical protein MUF42_17715 [Cytophagaceae bacterium]|jgi:nucleoside-diphosphate-sugar epimerase|nr:hypothetical protein [Cytophagaceae bacterium]
MKISFLGAGWLGFPLALEFQKAFPEAQIAASTTTAEKVQELNKAGFKGILLRFPERVMELPSEILESDLLVLSIPPMSRRQPPSYHANQIQSLLNLIPNSTRVIYTSSTSVYPDLSQTFTEDFLISENQTGHAGIWHAEQSVLQHASHNLIFRLAGLCGYDRFLARHFSGKKNLTNGNWPVNLVHRDDVIRAIKQVFSLQRSGIYNVCAPEHPGKQEYYTQQCLQYGLELPIYSPDLSAGKIISSAKLMSEPGFSFLFPDPRQFTYTRTSLQV